MDDYSYKPLTNHQIAKATWDHPSTRRVFSTSTQWSSITQCGPGEQLGDRGNDEDEFPFPIGGICSFPGVHVCTVYIYFHIHILIDCVIGTDTDTKR